MTIQVKCGEGNTNSSDLSSLKFLLLTYQHSHFLATTLDFASLAFLGATHFFYSWAIDCYNSMTITLTTKGLLLDILFQITNKN